MASNSAHNPMATQENRPERYFIYTGDASLHAVGGQHEGIPSRLAASLGPAVDPFVQGFWDTEGQHPGPSVAGTDRRMTEHLATHHSLAALPQAPNFEAFAHAPTLPPWRRAAAWSTESPTRSTSLPLPDDPDSQLFDPSTFGYPQDRLDGLFTQLPSSATTRHAGRDASNYSGPQPGDASRHHVPLPQACQPQHRLAAPVPSLNPADLELQGYPTYHKSLVNPPGPLYRANVPYPGQILSCAPNNGDNFVYHASLPTGVSRISTVSNATWNPLHHLPRPASAPAATYVDPALAPLVRFGVDEMPTGHWVSAPIAQPQQYLPGPTPSAQRQALLSSHATFISAPFRPSLHKLMESNNIPFRNQGDEETESKADDKNPAAPSAIHFIDIGKENIDPNAGVPQPSASSSSAPATDNPCVFPSCPTRLSGDRKEVRKHINDVHFPDHNVHDQVMCACKQTLRLGSLPQHITSRKHYGTALAQCDSCGKTFARGYMVEPHKKMCKGAQRSEPMTKKRRIA